MAACPYESAAIPANENERQKAVDRIRPKLSAKGEALQQIVEKAARTFDTPMAAVTLVDHDKQRLAARYGLDEGDHERSTGFCPHAIHRPGETMVVEDARLDRRFAGNPLVTGENGIRFYAGKPVISRDGYPLGTLCIIDVEPRDPPPNLIELTLLAREVEKVIES